jgi:hypothetical protein
MGRPLTAGWVLPPPSSISVDRPCGVNAYEVGFTPVWHGLRGAYRKNRTPEIEKPLEAFLRSIP